MPLTTESTPKRKSRQSKCASHSVKPSESDRVLTSRELSALFMREGLSENYFREQARFSEWYEQQKAAAR